jgi:hypothetical protein
MVGVEDEGPLVRALLADTADRGTGRAGHPRPQAVGADDVAAAEVDRSVGAVMPADPGDPAAAVALHAGHGDAGAYVGAGPLGGRREDRVQHVPPRRDDEVDPGLVLDRAAH